MSEPYHLITVGSWEARFLSGLKRVIERDRPATMQMYYFREYEDLSAENRDAVKVLCKEVGIELAETPVEFAQPAHTWKVIAEHIAKRRPDGRRVLVDISTMPRDVIWSLFFQLRRARAVIEYVYHRPETYSKDWLSRDPGKPRLLFKMSGISRFDRQTALVLTTGYDPERTQQLIHYFEPKRVVLFIQVGKQFGNEEQNIASHRKRLTEERKEYHLDTESIDAYAADHGEAVIAKWVTANLPTHNIIMSSLGPKLSAVAMFRLHERHPEVALCYAPSNDFNPEYSQGIGDTVTGNLDRK